MLDIIYEDNHLLAVNKPWGLLSQAAVAGDDTVVERARGYLRQRYGKPGNVYIGLVHRLDRNTSGVMLLAKTSKAAARLSEMFRRGHLPGGAGLSKRYIAIVHGQAAATFECVDGIRPAKGRGHDGHGVEVAAVGSPGSKRAHLRGRRVGAGSLDGAPLSAVEVTLLTGRKHQVRAQLAAAGLPLVGDRRYGRPPYPLQRHALHAAALDLIHPVRKTELHLIAPIPADLTALVPQGEPTGRSRESKGR